MLKTFHTLILLDFIIIYAVKVIYIYWIRLVQMLYNGCMTAHLNSVQWGYSVKISHIGSIYTKEKNTQHKSGLPLPDT